MILADTTELDEVIFHIGVRSAFYHTYPKVHRRRRWKCTMPCCPDFWQFYSWRCDVTRRPSGPVSNDIIIKSAGKLLKQSWRNKMSVMRMILALAATAALLNGSAAFQGASLPLSLRAGARSARLVSLRMWYYFIWEIFTTN